MAPSETGNQKVAPTLQLSRTGLVASLAAMFGLGLSVYAIFPESVGGPELPVLVIVDKLPVVTTGGKGAVITDVVVIENLSDHEIPKLTLDINGQYLYLQNSPMQPRETLQFPQRMFTDKRSSARFEPSKYTVEDIVVTGQLPSGARGVSTFEFQDASE